MTITGARLSGGELILTLSSPLEAARLVHKFKAGDYDLVKHKRKRSLDANAYCWTLIHKIAAKVGRAPVEVYRDYIRDIGGKVVVTCVQADDVETEVQSFLAGHIGRLVDVGDSRLPGCATLHKHYGSSDYDTTEMARLIDAIVQDCQALDIETRTPEELDSLLNQWEGRHG